MALETRHPSHNSSTSTIPNGEVDGTTLKYPTNIELVLPVLQELQSNPQAKTPAQTSYSLTFKEYLYLLDILPNLTDLRNIWGRNRIEYFYLFQQLVIMPSAGGRHEVAVTETVKWIEDPIISLIHQYKNNQDNLSEKDRKTWEWYELLTNVGTTSVDCLKVSHSPDAQFGSSNGGFRPLVLEVADSQKSKDLFNLAMEYLGLCKGLIKYMFAVDIRGVAHGVDVDFIMWKHVKVGKNKHSIEQCELHPLVRADGTQINTTTTVSYLLSHILGNPPEGCDDLIVELRISDLIRRIKRALPFKEFDKDNRKNIKLVLDKSITPPRFKEQEKAIQEFNNYNSGSEVDDEQYDKSYQPSAL